MSFTMPHKENGACDRVNQSHSSISSHTPVLGLTDSVEFHIDSINVLKQEPCLCTRQKSLCKHYLLSAQYRFSICKKLFFVLCRLWFLSLSKHVLISRHEKCVIFQKIWFGNVIFSSEVRISAARHKQVVIPSDWIKNKPSSFQIVAPDNKLQSETCFSSFIHL